MNHLGIFNTTGDVQTALNQETLVKPYVAKIGSTIDFNSLSPAPTTKGTWTLVGPGLYWFDIDTEADWSETLIAVVPDVWYDSTEHQDVSIKLEKPSANNWIMKFDTPDASNADEYYFESGVYTAITTSRLEVGEGSDRTPVQITWDAVGEFTFVAHDTTVATLVMNTINPPYSE